MRKCQLFAKFEDKEISYRVLDPNRKSVIQEEEKHEKTV